MNVNAISYTNSLASSINMLTAMRVFNEIQYQVFSARYSHRYFSNASRSSGGLKNDFSLRLFGTLKSLAVVEYNEGKCGIDYSNQIVSHATIIRKGIKWKKTWDSTPSGNFCCKRFDGLQNYNKDGYKY